jgi:hypothetical protein
MRILNTTDERPKNMPMNPEYVVCYSPGKVGSTSIMEALRTVSVPCHRCEDANIKQYHKRDWPTITPVRDPIAWIFSHIFELFVPAGAYPRPEDAPKLVDSIMYGRWNADLMRYCNWWGSNFRQITGINILANRWRKKDFFAIYSYRALVVRTDKFDDVLDDALRLFLPQYYPEIDLSTLEVQHRAKGVDRFNGYAEFMENVNFDLKWLADFYYYNDMCRYFFFVDELKGLVAKWVKG